MAISRWEVTRPVLLNTVGYHPSVRKKYNSSAEPQSWELPPDNYRKPAHRLIWKFFAEEFSRPVPVGSEDLYRVTVAIAERLLGFSPRGRPTIDSGEWISPEGPIRFGGILYPTLAMRANGDNVAILPEVIDTCLVLRSVDFLEIVNTDDLRFTIRTIDHAAKYTPEGEIEWTDRPPVPLPHSTSFIAIDPITGRLTHADSREAVEVVSAEPSYSFYDLFR
jgi:hypothetical protein